MGEMKELLSRAFSLTQDCASYEEIENRIRAGAKIYGTNLCVMMLAILIASIGLNMNATAVIIGAMLISPLMGTIMSIGYGLATADLKQMRDSAVGFLFQILVCLFTSTIYFMLSPISTAQSELLARTTPTIWDVLIAVCGGIAGTIGTTRRESSNVIPGVAIATALMPPLCTAGYGIAMGSLRYVSGALYLFFINAFFIALSTCFVMLILRVPVKAQLSEEMRKTLHNRARNTAIVLIIPSLFLGYQAVKNSVNDADPSQVNAGYALKQITTELKVLFPAVAGYETGVHESWSAETEKIETKTTATVFITEPLAEMEIEKLEDWLFARSGIDTVYLLPEPR